MKTRQMMVLAVLLGLLASQEAQAFYNPATGRWLNRDPIGESGGRNLYGFAANDPANEFDPDGRSIYGPTGYLLEAATERCCNLASGRNTERRLLKLNIHIGDAYFGGNAYLHCAAACRAARACGLDSAQRFWDGRETPGRLHDDMDLRNNAVGYRIQGDCWKGCLDAWRNGQLTCIVKDQEQHTPCPVPPKIYEDVLTR